MKYLNEIQCNDIVIIGLTTDHCVSTTTRHAHDLHLAALASLHEEFAFVTTTQEVCNACL
jgi:nicotinamidase-related amidase